MKFNVFCTPMLEQNKVLFEWIEQLNVYSLIKSYLIFGLRTQWAQFSQMWISSCGNVMTIEDCVFDHDANANCIGMDLLDNI
jgi:hypothetical protein